MSQVIEASPGLIQADWELDYYSRPILESDGKKRWELLVCSTTAAEAPAGVEPFRWVRRCPATSVNSTWLKEALAEAQQAAAEQGYAPPRRVRCWRASMRTMVQRAAEALGLELVPSRRCYALVEWLQERQATVYPAEEGYMAGPLAPPPQLIQPLAVPLPEAARGQSWSWASLPLGALREAGQWEISFPGLVALPADLADDVPVSGLRLIGGPRALAIAGWLAGLEPVRLAISDNQLVLEAGLEDRWLLGRLDAEEAQAAAAAFQGAREQAGGVQFLAVQASEAEPRFEGFWILRDLPDA
ncbi:Tab2/Atab2 family RNA-binding protein [Vulcanococcus limneticus Candia 3F8]|uniref:Tab2/Atab2 family RNA-binding protein n=1 Tax=Vulcanococcus limneticus TaxID=2170428 RepID=UPI000B981FBA|nr:Tab2/Atab2 family RNA-binding protein [Vulcanococcus limneticus]MCP9791889.1 Tab2/Atab2 family RNA-binding protein [Vulcanococcus limneticus MW73D5]MCP9893260.1 Tab2/Atab2 family RNA-binding protein [Vulcanococcus limneticus Candia 3F8]MCP9897403.1 Tab2/Atab2 family RNA-binding protein [Vulcanococcus limneticus Candia 3B3]